MPQAQPARILSVDVLRGLVVTLMIFVNDLSSAASAPRLFLHLPAEADGMSIADLVFPAFLFIAGMSIPLALGKVHAGALGRADALRRIGVRVLCLLAMGVVMVNADEHDPWGGGLWGACAYACLFATFCVVPEEPGRARTVLRRLRWGGALCLCALVFAYRGPGGEALVFGPLLGETGGAWLRHSWWGILGQIGWAWGVAALVYLLVGRRREWLLAVVFLLVLTFHASHAGLGTFLAGRSWLAPFLPVLQFIAAPLAVIDSHVGLSTTLGTLSALTLAGTALGTLLVGPQAEADGPARLRWALGFAGVLFLAGLLLDAPHGIGKIRATPAFTLYCGALTSLAWAGLFAWLDLGRRAFPSAWVQPAGANPLLAYLLHPFLCLLVGLAGARVEQWVFFYRALPWWGVCLGSLVVALAIVRLSGWLARAGLRLKV